MARLTCIPVWQDGHALLTHGSNTNKDGMGAEILSAYLPLQSKAEFDFEDTIVYPPRLKAKHLTGEMGKNETEFLSFPALVPSECSVHYFHEKLLG